MCKETKQIGIDLNDTAIAFPTVTSEIPSDTEIAQAVAEILLPTEQNKELVLHLIVPSQ